jgi:hypothetical protein
MRREEREAQTEKRYGPLPNVSPVAAARKQLASATTRPGRSLTSPESDDPSGSTGNASRRLGLGDSNR